MKKYIVSIALLLAMPALVLAAFKPATLTNGVNRVAVYTQAAAQKLFGQGYVLEGQKFPTQTCQTCPTGAVSGPDVYQKMNLHAGFQSGGKIQATTTTASAYTLLTGDIKYETTFWKVLPNVSTTFTTMATNTAAMANLEIPNVGDTREIWLYNASSTAAATITIAAGTGVDLQKNEDTANLATAGESITKLTFIRKLDTDVMLLLEQYDEAD